MGANDGLIKTCCSVDAQGKRCLEAPMYWIKINATLTLWLCAECYQVVLETMWNDAVTAARLSGAEPGKYTTSRRSGLVQALVQKDQGD
jgi:hypothetical protein